MGKDTCVFIHSLTHPPIPLQCGVAVLKLTDTWDIIFEQIPYLNLDRSSQFPVVELYRGRFYYWAVRWNFR
jgi:hypothetical protein